METRLLRKLSNAKASIPVIVHDGVEPVCDGEHGAVGKLPSDGLLDEVVGLEVHGSRGLVQYQDLRLPQQRSGQAD